MLHCKTRTDYFNNHVTVVNLTFVLLDSIGKTHDK